MTCMVDITFPHAVSLSISTEASLKIRWPHLIDVTSSAATYDVAADDVTMMHT